MLIFIKNIPQNVYEEIYSILGEYNEYMRNDANILSRRDISISKDVLGTDECNYSLDLDMVLDSLTIIKSIFVNGRFQKEFELKVYAGNKVNIVDLFGQQMLGCFYDKTDNIYVDYDLVDTLLGRMVAYSENGNFKKYKWISLSEIPEEFNIRDFSDKYAIVRTRNIGKVK